MRDYDKLKRYNYWSSKNKLFTLALILSLLVMSIVLKSSYNHYNLLRIQCTVYFGQAIGISSVIGILIYTFSNNIFQLFRYLLILSLFLISQVSDSNYYDKNNNKYASVICLGACILVSLTLITNFSILKRIFKRKEAETNDFIILANKEFYFLYSSTGLISFLFAKLIIQIVMQHNNAAAKNKFDIEKNIFLNVVVYLIFVISISILSQLMILKVATDLKV
jgi:hypothetical protein